MKTNVARLTLCLGLVLMLSVISAQDGKLSLHANIGLAPTFLKDHQESKMMPLAFEVQYRISSNFSLGAYWGQSISSGEGRPSAGSDMYKFTNNYRIVSLRPTIHTSPLNKAEFYGGMYLGYAYSEVEQERLSDARGPEIPESSIIPQANKGMFLSAFIGGRYHVSKSFGLQAELGMGVTLLSGGVYLRL